MNYVQKLPFILAASMAILSGLISMEQGMETKQTCIRMTTVMVVFFILGVVARSVIMRTVEEVEEKRKALEEAELERLRAEQEAQLPEDDGKPNGSKIDYRIEDNTGIASLFDEEFVPFDIHNFEKQ